MIICFGNSAREDGEEGSGGEEKVEHAEVVADIRGIDHIEAYGCAKSV